MRLLPRRRWFQFRITTWFALTSILAWVMLEWPWVLVAIRPRNLTRRQSLEWVETSSLNPALVWPALALAAFVGWLATSANLRHRWLRMGIRPILAIVAAFSVWAGYQENWIRERHAFLDEQENRSLRYRPVDSDTAYANPDSAPNLLWLFGENPRGRVLVVFPTRPSQMTAAHASEIQHAKSLFPEANVAFTYPP